jgi:plastocyanin
LPELIAGSRAEQKNQLKAASSVVSGMLVHPNQAIGRSSMKVLRRFSCGLFYTLSFMAMILGVPRTAQGQQNWTARVGGQSKDMGRQVEAFLPNEFWIHAGDKITWKFASGDIHTVTFLLVGQPFPLNLSAGCPGFSSSGAAFDGSACVTSTPSAAGQNFAVTFPAFGNYEIVCLVHPEMFGVVHVLNSSALLPHDQDYYDAQAETELRALLDDGDPLNGEKHHHPSMAGMLSARGLSSASEVVAGFGQIAATPGGQQAFSLVRFINETVEVHAGDTVEWTNWDPIIAHTITFGVEPTDQFDPSCGPVPGCQVAIDPDGALHATITGPGQNVHSGFILAALEGYTGGPPVPQPPLFPPTRFRVTFTKPGTYNYKCALHDTLGMVGKVVVIP